MPTFLSIIISTSILIKGLHAEHEATSGASNTQREDVPYNKHHERCMAHYGCNSTYLAEAMLSMTGNSLESLKWCTLDQDHPASGSAIHRPSLLQLRKGV
jgi:hypothetical protein